MSTVTQNTASQSTVRPKVIYPESDGQPMAENTVQFRWIVTIEGGLDSLYRNDPNVFVAGDLFWYPVEGDNSIRVAPDTMVVFGRPKGDRGSYMQWVEGGIAPQVVFEVISPVNRFREMLEKFDSMSATASRSTTRTTPIVATWRAGVATTTCSKKSRT